MFVIGNKKEKQKKMILELFKINLHQLPCKNCEFIREDIKHDLRRYTRKLEQLEFGIFDFAVIHDFNDLPSKNIVLYTSKHNRLTANQMKHVVDSIADIYGKDNNGFGKWDNDDDNAVMNQLFWSGRMWSNKKKESNFS